VSEPDTRTEAEIAATIAKLNAEADQAQAAAAQAHAEARKTQAEATANEIAAEAAVVAWEHEQAKDEYNHRYRFCSVVSESAVNACISRLTRWHRLSPGCDIEIIFSSPGGSIIDGFALYDYIRYLSNEGHHITTGTLGEAASMAGILLQAGDHRWAGREAWVLIHRAAFGEVGKTYEIDDRVKWVKRIETRIINIFVAKSGGLLTAQKIRKNWERTDWWLDSDECLELGVVDEVRG
jgi:ATP-dependent Clp endopeptidase proteolytic subunit ClpP